MALLDYYQQFQDYFINADIAKYGSRESKFIGGPENSVKKIIAFKPLEKGCEMWVEGAKYPVRTHSSGMRVGMVGQVKRLIPLLTKTLKRKILFMLNLECIIDWMHYYLSDVYLKEQEYSQPVRELYRIIKNDKIRDVVCAIMEYDTAYRFRAQDVIVFLRKDKGIIWNTNTLIDLLIERDISGNMKAKWKKLKLLSWTVIFNRKLCKEIKEMIRQINLNEMKSSVEDRYWQADYKDYNFEGLTYDERQKLKSLL